MKSICLVVLLLGLAYAVEEKPALDMPPASNSSRCIYSVKDEKLSCQDGQEMVECEAAFDVTRLNLSSSFKIFAIEKIEKAAEKVRFNLYPRQLDNASFVDSEFVVDGTPVHISLYTAEKQELPGIRVEKSACFDKLVKLFVEPVEKHVVKIGEKEVSLACEVLIMDKDVKKRWLWGLGFGWPFFGLGLGFGWGLPFWG